MAYPAVEADPAILPENAVAVKIPEKFPFRASRSPPSTNGSVTPPPLTFVIHLQKGH